MAACESVCSRVVWVGLREVKGIVWWYRVQMERRRMKQGLEGVRQGWDWLVP